jgi:membrane protein DedA with SNARE-associated domain
MDQIVHIIEQYGIYAVFVLCTIEGDITLLTSGVMAHSNSFGPYSFLQVFIAGTLGGLAGDLFGYFIGRIFRETVKNYRYYQMAQPRIEKLVNKFGGFAIIVSKYIYGIRVAMCIFNGISMPFWRYLLLDAISCAVWVLILAGIGYFFGSAITTVIGDFHQIGIVLGVVAVIGVISFYLIERFWLSKKVEEANPETIHKIEEKIHVIEEGIQERLHLTSSANREEKTPPINKDSVKTEKD